MAIWDVGFFDNDMACDWENEITNNRNSNYIESALLPVINNDEDTLDIDISCKALAACEALARLIVKEGESSSYTKHLDKWVDESDITPSKELIKTAIYCIESITSAGSELKQYWTLRGELDNWNNKIVNLRKRLENI